ncbi:MULTISPECIES: AAA family ATPase [Oceanospirillaceae]|jgi:MoxR-like ATPase|uniref:AAA family ATPase n=1 Tax=Oceanospirillaceae TaxID=135620 RepID=UPI001191F4E2|nr:MULTISPECIES: MoxR family ATPase [Thalassolituus]MCA6059975.1 MoxR family ATPase [Thalassolituus sp. ST750PaO-4]MCB2387510.1 AAA family ATPase [Thalassolituus alkanivorans]MCB2425191.1 AAA family ATPase [Thalassolituus alkanivorans]TVV43972.1 MoxR family ATPase [Thalassolituus sp. C2-1]|tara:strand:- start:78 stop:1004 length:927 start_codon:yes stop_codon:yes gene_type:complete
MTTPIQRALEQLSAVILGKEEQLKLALSCLLARGHLLIEDLPGMGKTTLSHALAGVLGLQYNRIQFTSDLLPADILGVSIFERESGSDVGRFRFHPGPVFTQLLLADEINRATPKAQSALLEAMEEGQVTVEGETRPLPMPFFVIATQNPVSQSGTFPLPESQLDRFLMRIQLGYPNEKAERELLEGRDRRTMASNLKPLLTTQELAQLQQQVNSVQASASVLDYVQRIIAFTRYEGGFQYGLSPRGALALLRSAKAWALVDGNRQHLLPEDIQAVLPAVVDHRLAEAADGGAHSVSQRILNTVPVLV